MKEWKRLLEVWISFLSYTIKKNSKFSLNYYQNQVKTEYFHQ